MTRKRKLNNDTYTRLPRYLQVTEKLRESLITRGYKVGDKLPSESELMSLFGISRGTARSALEPLVQEGLLKKRTGSGAYVNRLPDLPALQRRVGMFTWLNVEIQHHPNVMPIYSGINSYLKPLNYEMDIYPLTPEEIDLEHIMGIINRRNWLGIMQSIDKVSPEITLALSERVPLVSALPVFTGKGRVHFDFVNALQQICRYLHSLGHRRVAFINNNSGPDNEMVQAFLSAAQELDWEAGLDDITGTSYSPEEGKRCTLKLLKRKLPPTAIIAGDDYIATGIYSALRQKGLSCPEDISVVSFGDMPFAPHLAPPLTTMKLPFFELGRTEAQILVNRIEGKACSEDVSLKGELVIRESATQVPDKALMHVVQVSGND